MSGCRKKEELISSPFFGQKKVLFYDFLHTDVDDTLESYNLINRVKLEVNEGEDTTFCIIFKKKKIASHCCVKRFFKCLLREREIT